MGPLMICKAVEMIFNEAKRPVKEVRGGRWGGARGAIGSQGVKGGIKDRVRKNSSSVPVWQGSKASWAMLIGKQHFFFSTSGTSNELENVVPMTVHNVQFVKYIFPRKRTSSNLS